MTANDGIPGPRRPSAWLLLVAVFALFAILMGRFAMRPERPTFLAPEFAPKSSGDAHYRALKVSTGATRFAHAPTLVELSDGKLRAFWFGGSREGATDSAIYTALFVPAQENWGEARPIFDARQVQRDLHRLVRKLGNPTAVHDASGRLWLFFVSVTVGGWSGSSVNFVTSDDDGETWSRVQRLVTSPFMNLSTLVKGAPIIYADGSFGLPMYHEMIGKFGEILRLRADGEILDKTRLSAGRDSLQPVIVPRSERAAVGFMRYAGPPPARVLMVSTEDAGDHWREPAKLALPNPNSAIDAVALDGDRVLLVLNNLESNRNDLSLAYSADGGITWRVVHQFEYTAPSAQGQTAEYSYPRLLRTRDGSFHLVYSAGKAEVRHIRFNHQWLDKKL